MHHQRKLIMVYHACPLPLLGCLLGGLPGLLGGLHPLSMHIKSSLSPWADSSTSQPFWRNGPVLKNVRCLPLCTCTYRG